MNSSMLCGLKKEGYIPIQPKSLGRGLMVNNFVTKHDILLKMSNSESEWQENIRKQEKYFIMDLLMVTGQLKSFFHR